MKVSLQQPVLRLATYIDGMSDPGITRFLADREHAAAEAPSAPSAVYSTHPLPADRDAASGSATDLHPVNTAALPQPFPAPCAPHGSGPPRCSIAHLVLTA